SSAAPVRLGTPGLAHARSRRRPGTCRDRSASDPPRSSPLSSPAWVPRSAAGRIFAETARERSAARVRLSRLELVADEGLVANDPGVVAGFDHVGVAGCELDLCAVLVAHREAPGGDDADVPVLAAVLPGDRLDALGPAPAGLKCEAAGAGRADPDEVDA